MAFTRAAFAGVLCLVCAGAAFGKAPEKPGLAITLPDPLPAGAVLLGKKAQFPIRAKVTEAGGMPDPDKLKIEAILEKDGKTYPAIPLTYIAQPGIFGGEIAIDETGDYTIDIRARDAATGHTGELKIPMPARDKVSTVSDHDRVVEGGRGE